MPYRVRGAAEADIPWMLGGLRGAARWADLPDLYPDPEYAKERILEALKPPHILIVAELDSCKPVGFLGAYVVPHIYNPRIMWSTVAVWWVDLEYRLSRAALMLLNSYVRLASQTCRYVTVALGWHTPIKEASLLKRGFKLLERSYTLRVEE